MARKLWIRKGVVSLGSDDFRKRVGRLSCTPEYHAWRAMLARCYSRKVLGFKHYGGRGIKVEKRWFNFEFFYSDMGKKPTRKHSINRINNDMSYSRDNCIWSTSKEQQNNKRNNSIISVNGVSLTVAQWSEKIGVKQNTITCRLRRGRTSEEAILGRNFTKEESKENKKRKCLTCGAEFYPRLQQTRRGGGRFCSHKCQGVAFSGDDNAMSSKSIALRIANTASSN